MSAQAYFEGPPAEAPVAGRLLLLSYHFPPASSAGAQRWAGLAPHLRAAGFGLDVVARDPRELSRSDADSLEQLPPGLRAFGVPDSELRVQRLERGLAGLRRRLRCSPRPRASQFSAASSVPSSLARSDVRWAPLSLRSGYRAYLGWADVARGAAWARAAAAVGERLIAREGHRLLLSCGPPHMVHEGARRLAARTGTPHVADLRDPWSLVERLPEDLATPTWFRLAERYEARVLRDAALVVMNTEPARDAMRRRHPEFAERIVAVPNGCDPIPPPEVERDPRFVVAYAGTVYLDRSPELLFRAAARLVKECELGPRDFALALMGDIQELDGRSVLALAEQEGVADFLELRPPGSRSEAEAFMARSSLLVSLPQDSRLAIPSKIYEYMRFEAGLLALAEAESATAELLRGSSADVVAPDDVEGLARVLLRRYREHRAGRRPEALAGETRFGRGARAAQLIDHLQRILARERGAGRG